VRLLRASSQAIVGSRVGSIPITNTVRSIPEVMYRAEVRRHVRAITEVSPPHVESYEFPAHYPPQFRRDKAFDARYAYSLTDVVLGPESGVCWLPEGPVLQESVGSLMRILGWGNCLHEMLRAPVERVTTGPVVPFPPAPYFHWLFEVLPAALRAAEADDRATLLVHPDSPRYLRDAAQLFFAGLRSSGPLVSACPVAVRDARIVTIDEFAGFVAGADVELLRARVEKLMRPLRPEGRRFLFISRQLARDRKHSETPKATTTLDSLGYETVRAETLSLHHQIGLFSTAGVIAGLHGAGLANMVWAQPGCRIVEFFHGGVFNDCYARLAVTCGHEYSYAVLGTEGLTDRQLRDLLPHA
jgi:hypothetical protein